MWFSSNEKLEKNWKPVFFNPLEWSKYFLSLLPLSSLSLSLSLSLRFPLFGGWQTRYYIGYNLPSYEYLYHSGSQFLLNMRLVDHVMDDQLVQDLTLRIVLPEGAKLVCFLNFCSVWNLINVGFLIL